MIMRTVKNYLQKWLKMTTKLSIIIPIYNTEKYLGKCLDSILAQTFGDFEVICIDDGSTDNSSEILTEYAQEDRRVKVIYQKNKRAGVARNNGLAKATGEFISFVDSDDWIEPNTYELAFKNITEEIDLLCFGAKIVIDDSSEGKIDTKHLENIKQYQKINFKGKVELNDSHRAGTNVCLWNKIFRTSIIKKHNIRFPEGIEHDDDAFYYKYSLVCKKAYYMQDTLYNYLQRSNSIMDVINNKKDIRIYDRMLAWYDIYLFLESENILQYHLDLIVYLFKLYIFFDYNYCKDEQKSILLEKISEIAIAINLGEYEKKESCIQKLREKDFSVISEILKEFHYNF